MDKTNKISLQIENTIAENKDIIQLAMKNGASEIDPKDQKKLEKNNKKINDLRKKQARLRKKRNQVGEELQLLGISINPQEKKQATIEKQKYSERWSFQIHKERTKKDFVLSNSDKKGKNKKKSHPRKPDNKNK